MFIVTKVPPGGNSYAGVPKYLKRSLQLLQLDYIDLYLIHTPFGFKDVEGELHPHNADGEIDLDLTTNHAQIWKAMEEQLEAGLVKSIGISNFNVKQLTNLIEKAKSPPVSLQIELHAYHQQKELVNLCKKHNITVTAYSPLGSPGLGKFMAQFGAQYV